MHAQLLGPTNKLNYSTYTICGLTFVYMLFNIPAPHMRMKASAQQRSSKTSAKASAEKAPKTAAKSAQKPKGDRKGKLRAKDE